MRLRAVGLLLIVTIGQCGWCAIDVCGVLDRVEHGRIADGDDLASLTQVIAERPGREEAYVATFRGVRAVELGKLLGKEGGDDLLPTLNKWCNDERYSPEEQAARKLVCLNVFATDYARLGPKQLGFLNDLVRRVKGGETKGHEGLMTAGLLKLELAKLEAGVAVATVHDAEEYWRRYDQEVDQACKTTSEPLTRTWIYVIAVEQALRSQAPARVSDSMGRKYIRPGDRAQKEMHLLDGLAMALKYLGELKALPDLPALCNGDRTKVLLQINVMAHARLSGDYRTVASLGEEIIPHADELTTNVAEFLYEETGYAYYQAFANYRRALELYDKALRIAPTDDDLQGKISVCRRDMEAGMKIENRPQSFYY